MKLDRLKLAELIGYCANRGMTVDKVDVLVIDSITEIVTDVGEGISYLKSAVLDELIKNIQQLDKIPAIKQYRILTGSGLKEAKDAIEKHWKSEPQSKSRDNIATIINSYFRENGIYVNSVNSNMLETEANKLACLIVQGEDRS